MTLTCAQGISLSLNPRVWVSSMHRIGYLNTISPKHNIFFPDLYLASMADIHCAFWFPFCLPFEHLPCSLICTCKFNWTFLKIFLAFVKGAMDDVFSHFSDYFKIKGNFKIIVFLTKKNSNGVIKTRK